MKYKSETYHIIFELSSWMCKWDLELAIQKCSIMTFGNINTHSYTINNI